MIPYTASGLGCNSCLLYARTYPPLQAEWSAQLPALYSSTSMHHFPRLACSRSTPRTTFPPKSHDVHFTFTSSTPCKSTPSSLASHRILLSSHRHSDDFAASKSQIKSFPRPKQGSIRRVLHIPNPHGAEIGTQAIRAY